MSHWFLFVSVLVGCAICWPLFRYMYKAVIQNAPEFDQGYTKVVKRDATEDFFHANGSRDSTVNTFVFTNVVVLLLPLIPACFIAVPFYFLIRWLYQLAT